MYRFYRVVCIMSNVVLVLLLADTSVNVYSSGGFVYLCPWYKNEQEPCLRRFTCVKDLMLHKRETYHLGHHVYRGYVNFFDAHTSCHMLNGLHCQYTSPDSSDALELHATTVLHYDMCDKVREMNK